MPLRIEDYALIGDCQTAALVGRDGSIDWLCASRASTRRRASPRCSARQSTAAGCSRRRSPGPCDPPALPRGHAGPRDRVRDRGRRPSRVIDFMPLAAEAADLVRIVEGVRGQVPMRMELVLRFDYGSIVPWVRRTSTARHLGDRRAGRALISRADVATARRGPARPSPSSRSPRASGSRSYLTWHPSHRRRAAGARSLPGASTRPTRGGASGRIAARIEGEWREAVHALADHAQGADLRADRRHRRRARRPRCPSSIGGVRNWDYRYCWLRDATFTLYALMIAGYIDEAARLARVAAARRRRAARRKLQIMYGLAGERRLTEFELAWLPGLRGLAAGADRQRRRTASSSSTSTARCWTRCTRRDGAASSRATTRWQRRAGAAATSSRAAGSEPDEGIWEVRGPRRHFTHSKVMAWVAFDRAVKAVERFGLDGPGRPLAARCATRSTPRSAAQGFDAGAERVRPVLRLDASSTPAC